MKLFINLSILSFLMTLPSMAYAKTSSFLGYTLKGMTGTLFYSFEGFAILLVAYLIFDVFAPYDLTKEIAEDDNTAVGILLAGLFLSLSIIIAAAIV